MSNSPWMRGAPQSGLARAMVRTSSASSDPMRGRPVRPRRDFQVQNERKPFRCQRITVSGRTMWSASRHPAQRRESQTQKARSSDPNRGRFDRRRSRASCCLSARFSSARFLWVLTAARRAPSRGRRRDIAPTSLRGQLLVQSRDRVLANDTFHFQHPLGPFGKSCRTACKT